MDSTRTCFFEAAPHAPLRRRAAIEFIGTAFLVLAVAGAGVALESTGPELSGAANLVSAFATCGALIGLITALGPVSGGHFNPLVTSLQWLLGQRGHWCTAVYCAAQVAGAAAGALLADSLAPSATRAVVDHASLNFAWSEVVATASLLFIVASCSVNRVRGATLAVAGWLAAAIISTPSGCYANPALVLSALLARGRFAQPAPTCATYIGAEIVGCLIAFGLVSMIYFGARSASMLQGPPPAVARNRNMKQ
jgi:glycerol uptake facilitator-like aquaporin